jgi:leader peptidase (prepilin peptidase)/N-methyltransferase
MRFPDWTVLMGLFFGATIGSFLNVVIYRMPRGLSLSNPKNSFCPNCKHQLGIPDLFPLLSWLFLRGKCRHCGVKVPARYFFVELLTGAIWAGIWWQYVVVTLDPARAAAYALASASLVAVIFIDWEFFIIPDQVNAFLFFVGVAYNIYLYAIHDASATIGGWPSSLVGALVGIGVLWGIAFIGRIVFRKDAMGHGDIKMARGIGAVLLPGVALLSFGLAVVLGAVLGIAQILARQAAESRQAKAAMASGGMDEPNQTEDPNEEEDLPPESIGSLLWCGLGYVACIDIWGLFYKPLYLFWFKEDPFSEIVNENDEIEDFEIAQTMIPFGPYLALGAIIATVFQAQLLGYITAYSKWAGFSPGNGEHQAVHSRLSFDTNKVLLAARLRPDVDGAPERGDPEKGTR